MLLAVAAAVAVGAFGMLAYSFVGGSDDAGGADVGLRADAVVAGDANTSEATSSDAVVDNSSGEVAAANSDAAAANAAEETASADGQGNEAAPELEPVDQPLAEPAVVAAGNDPASEPATDPAASQPAAGAPEEAPLDAVADEAAASEPVVETPAEPVVASADDAPIADTPAESPADAADSADPDVPVAAAGEVQESMGIVRNGQIFLEGAVPSVEAGEELEALAAEILGPDNVFNNYVVDPLASDASLGNLTVEDTINFQTNSAVILSDGDGLLNQGLALMTIRPEMTITIVGHTDDRGAQEANVILSVARAEAVKQWFVDNGIDPSRLTAEGAGESDPIADNSTAEGQRLNRRIQFFLDNLLG